jgi:hypothetical protein
MSDQPRREYQPGALPLGGLLLVAVGVLLLLQTIGVVPWGLWLELWRFWPVLLVVAGGFPAGRPRPAGGDLGGPCPAYRLGGRRLRPGRPGLISHRHRDKPGRAPE